MRVFRIICFVIVFCYPNFVYADSLSAAQDLKIISLAPSITEMLFALGLDNQIVGIDSYSDYPLQTQQKQKIGSFLQPNLELIITLNPDIIFTAAVSKKEKLNYLKNKGINVIEIDVKSIKEIFNAFLKIGKLTGRQSQAEKIVKEIKKRINKIKKKTRNITQKDKKKVFVEIWSDPVTTIGKKSFLNEIIDIAGGVNIASDLNKEYSVFSSELVISRNPDVIILGYMSLQGHYAELLKKRIGWENINAVKNDMVYDDIDPNIFLRPGPRIADAIEQIYKRLYE